MIFNIEAKLYNGKKRASSTNGAVCHNCMSACRRIKIDPYLSHILYSSSSGRQYNPATLNLIEKKVERSLKCMSTRDQFLNIIPVTQTQRPTINKWHLLKLRRFCTTKDIDNKTNGQPTEWEKSSSTHIR